MELGLIISHIKFGMPTMVFPTNSNFLSHITNKSGTRGFFIEAIFIGSFGSAIHKSVLSGKRLQRLPFR